MQFRSEGTGREWCGPMRNSDPLDLITTAVCLPITVPYVIGGYVYDCVTGQRRDRERRRLERERLEKERVRKWKKERKLIAARQEAEREAEYRDYVRKIRLPEYLLEMDWRELEDLSCELLKRSGYEVETTSRSGDHGVDALLRKDNELTVLQCKRWKGSVGESVVRDLYGSMCHLNATAGMIVTTGKVSAPAREWIGDKNIRIVDLSELANLVRDSFHESDIVPGDFTPKQPQTEHCPRCHRLLKKRRSRYGKFLGCSGYPSCDYTLNTRKT